jgi:tetratricopeptide (TPR) repeat protein
MLDDKGPLVTPSTQNLETAEQSLREVVEQLERMPEPRPLRNLSSAWRRLAVAESRRGDFRRAIASSGRARHYAALWQRISPGLLARENSFLTVVNESKILAARGDKARAAKLSLAALRQFERLPPSVRRRYENSRGWQGLLVTASRELELLGHHVESASLKRQALDNSIRLGFSGPRDAAVTGLLVTAVANGRRHEIEPLCGQAKEWHIFDLQVLRICSGGKQVSRRDWASDPLAMERLNARVRFLELELEHEASFRRQIDLATAQVELAEMYYSRGERDIARQWLDRSGPIIQGMQRVDPEGPKVNALQRRRAVLLGRGR